MCACPCSCGRPSCTGPSILAATAPGSCHCPPHAHAAANAAAELTLHAAHAAVAAADVEAASVDHSGAQQACLWGGVSVVDQPSLPVGLVAAQARTIVGSRKEQPGILRGKGGGGRAGEGREKGDGHTTAVPLQASPPRVGASCVPAGPSRPGQEGEGSSGGRTRSPRSTGASSHVERLVHRVHAAEQHHRALARDHQAVCQSGARRRRRTHEQLRPRESRHVQLPQVAEPEVAASHGAARVCPGTREGARTCERDEQEA